MEIKINFPGGTRVDAQFGSFTVRTDQPASEGGENSAPSPFELFLASLATCAGFYVLGFCRKRSIPTESIRLIQRAEEDAATGKVVKVVQEIQLPATFPEQYKSAVMRAAESCFVKKHLEKPPQFEISTIVLQA